MSNDYSVPQPEQRPGVVTVGGFTQFVVLGLAALYAIAGIVQATPVIDAASQTLQQEDAIPAAETDTAITVMYLAGYGTVLLVPLYALSVAIMGIFVLRGRNGARITTWVLAGGGLCCSGLSSMSLPFAGADPAAQMQFGAAEDELSRSMEEAIANTDIPAWTTPVSIVTTILATVAFLLIIILLALPAANNYFRKPPPQDIPPAAFPG